MRINHLLCMYLCFPICGVSDFSLRHTGNQGLEAIHGMFRGGTNSLPIISPNLSFREFLDKMNSAQQIQRAEHALNQTEGSTIMASKKKCKTFAFRSNDTDAVTQTDYALPKIYEEYLAQLERATEQGNVDSKNMIEQLAPQMEALLKSENLWEAPTVPRDAVSPHISIVTSLDKLSIPDTDFLTELQTQELGPFPVTTEITSQNDAVHMHRWLLSSCR